MTYDQIRTSLLISFRKYIKEHTDRITWKRDKIKRFQENQYHLLMQHVLTHSPYYRERCQHAKQLSEIIPSTKKEIMAHWDKIVCVPKLTREIAEEHLQKYRNKEINNPFFQNQYYITATGGSSGLRGLFVWDLNYFTIVGYAAFRYQYRDEKKHPLSSKRKIAVLTAPTLIHASTPLFSLTLDHTDEVICFPVDLKMQNLCKQLTQFQPTHLIGYSSVITELAYQELAGHVHILPKRVSTNSEPLAKDSRKIVRQAWNREINNMWGSVEMGMVGIESDAHCGMFISDDLLIIETVDEHYQPVQQPEEAKKLLVTNLFNFSFPLIRYVVDDTVFIEETKKSGFRIAKEIEGRADDWFIYNKHVQIHPMIFRSILGQISAISEYQVEQTAQGAIIRLLINEPVSLEKLNRELTQALQEGGVGSPVIQIEIANTLPRHQETGKLKRFIPIKERKP